MSDALAKHFLVAEQTLDPGPFLMPLACLLVRAHRLSILARRGREGGVVPGTLACVSAEHPLALGEEVALAQVEELLHGHRGWIGDAVPVEELVAGPAARHLVGGVLNPLDRVAEALAPPRRDHLNAREGRPR